MPPRSNHSAAKIAATGAVIAAVAGAAITGGFGLLSDKSAQPHQVNAIGGASHNIGSCVSGGVVVEGTVNCPKTVAQPGQPVAGFAGGCGPYQVFAQDRWSPLGTTVRAQPNVLSASVATFPGNMSLSVNGWVHGRAAYPTNVPPFNSDIWFHLSDGVGWVSFGGVRALPTHPDPTGVADGGPPAPAPTRCGGAVA